jgi:hypothetical protein
MPKRFDPELHAKTDNLAKTSLMNLFQKSAISIIENPNRHGVDLLAYKDNDHVFNVEVEIKTNWKEREDFRFPNVNFLRRKEKYCSLDKPTIFVIFNKDLSQYLAVRDRDVLASPLEEVRNKYVYSGELFYKIPLNKVSFNNIGKVVKELLNE